MSFIIAVVCLVLAAGLWYQRGRALAIVGDLGEARAAGIGELSRLSIQVAEEIGHGAWSEFVKVRGTIEPEDTLKAPLSGRPCVWYRTRVVREWEEAYETTDSHGHCQTRTRKGSDTVSAEEEHAPFWLRDGSGRCRVEPRGAEVELVCTVDKFEREPGCYGTPMSLFGHHHPHGRETLGYRYHEEILPVKRDVLVVGDAVDAAGELVLKRPAKKDDALTISLKDEHELRAAKQGNATAMGAGAAVFAVVAVAFVVMGFAEVASHHRAGHRAGHPAGHRPHATSHTTHHRH